MFSGDHAERQMPGCLRVFVRLAVMAAVVLSLTWVFHTFAYQIFAIPSGSMEDTFTSGDSVFVEKLSSHAHNPEQGDIIVFRDPLNPRDLIKRVIATGGQTVDLVDGKVVVDGVTLDEPYTEGKRSEPFKKTGVPISYPYTVPEGELWVMGDNRTSSQDSRYFGSVKVSSVVGHALFVSWPLNHVKMLA